MEPYRELIEQLRTRGRTYREIAQILAEKCQLQILRSAINDFARVQSRRKSLQQKPLRVQRNQAVTSAAAKQSAAEPTIRVDDDSWKRREELKRRPPPVPLPPETNRIRSERATPLNREAEQADDRHKPTRLAKTRL
jgi:hypothetical protein